MPVKCNSQPFCRWCGRPISKWTISGHIARDDANPPRSKADLSRYTNQTVVYVRYRQDGAWNSKTGQFEPSGNRLVRDFSTWDGESYEDDLFCNSTHAQLFGRQAARQHGFGMPAYIEAIRRSR